MYIFLDEIYYYFLTNNNPTRKKHIIKEFKNLKLIEVNPIANIEGIRSGASGFCKIFDLSSINQDKNKPFQPFCIFEDDVKKYREFPKTIEIPDNTDILHIGLSIYGNNPDKYCSTIYFKNIDKDIIRIYNMLALHGIIICSLRGLLSMQKCILEDFFKNRPWDISSSLMQPYLNVYALKIPLVYQYGLLGGQEYPTKVNFINKDDKIIPDENINTDNISVLLAYKTYI